MSEVNVSAAVDRSGNPLPPPPDPQDAFKAVKTMEIEGLRQWVEAWTASRGDHPHNQQSADEDIGEEEDPARARTSTALLGSAAVIKEVLDNMRDDSPKQSTLLHWASYLGFIEAVNYFLDLGASPFVQESDGKTPLHWAGFEGHNGVVSALLRASEGLVSNDTGMPIEQARDRLNHTACHLALINRNDACAELFPNFHEVKGARSTSPYRGRSRGGTPSISEAPTTPRDPIIINLETPRSAATAATTSVAVGSEGTADAELQALAAAGGGNSKKAPSGKPPLTPNRAEASSDSPHQLQSVVPALPLGQLQQHQHASAYETEDRERTRSPSQNRWARRNRNRGSLTPRSSQPPPRVGELKAEAEEEELRPFLEQGGVPQDRTRSESYQEYRQQQQQQLEEEEGDIIDYDDNGRPIRSAVSQSGRSGSNAARGNTAPNDREVSPGGVAYHPQQSTTSYDELPDENDPDLTEEERAVIRELQAVQRQKEKADRRRAREERRAERSTRLSEIRGYIQNWVSHSLNTDEAPPPQELLASLENAGIIPQRSPDGKIYWVGDGRDKARRKAAREASQRTSRSRGLSSSRDGWNPSSSLQGGGSSPAYQRGHSNPPYPDSRVPVPYGGEGGDAMMEDVTAPNTARSQPIRIPSTRFPPSTPLWEPRVSSRSRSHRSGSAARPSWKPPTAARSDPLECPQYNPRVERLHTQDKQQQQQQAAPPSSGTPMKRGTSRDFTSPGGGAAPRPRNNIPQPTAASPMAQ